MTEPVPVDDLVPCKVCGDSGWLDADAGLRADGGIWKAAFVEGQRDGAVKALRAFADAHRMPWCMFRRADGSAVTVSDLLLEEAKRIEEGSGGPL